MDDDLEAIVSISEETEGECGSSLVADEWGFAEGEEAGQNKRREQKKSYSPLWKR